MVRRILIWTLMVHSLRLWSHVVAVLMVAEFNSTVLEICARTQSFTVATPQLAPRPQCFACTCDVACISANVSSPRSSTVCLRWLRVKCAVDLSAGQWRTYSFTMKIDR